MNETKLSPIKKIVVAIQSLSLKDRKNILRSVQKMIVSTPATKKEKLSKVAKARKRTKNGTFTPVKKQSMTVSA